MHSHHHHHHHHHHAPIVVKSVSSALIWGIVINLVYIIIEAGAGIWQNSMGLLADAGHNLSDVASLALSLLAIKLYQKKVTKKFTYGYKKSTILVSLTNAVILLIAVGGIIIESLQKIMHPAQLEGFTVALIAGIGVFVNALTAYLFIDSKDNDLNIKGAYLHMAMDALVSVGVVIAGIVIHYTGWYIIDPIIGFIVAAIIIKSSWALLADSIKLSLDGVPENVDINQIEECIAGNTEVESFHHLHVWAISTTDNALTAHIVPKDITKMDSTKALLKEALKELGINHATLEFETSSCKDKDCYVSLHHKN